jgi:hypothetical protein
MFCIICRSQGDPFDMANIPIPAAGLVGFGEAMNKAIASSHSNKRWIADCYGEEVCVPRASHARHVYVCLNGASVCCRCSRAWGPRRGCVQGPWQARPPRTSWRSRPCGCPRCVSSRLVSSRLAWWMRGMAC